jgi:hypothetical protein
MPELRKLPDDVLNFQSAIESVSYPSMYILGDDVEPRFCHMHVTFGARTSCKPSQSLLKKLLTV